MCLCKGGGGLLIRRGPGLTVIVDHVGITDDELVGIACYCCFDSLLGSYLPKGGC